MADTSDFERLLREMEAYAAEYHVPIINENGRKVFLSVIREVRPHRVLEIGTAIGYSALLLAANGAADAQVTTLELSEERAALAHSFIARSPYEGRIEILQGDAGELLTELAGPYDFVFIDAAKGQYVDYFEKVQPLLTADATIVADNVLFRGYVMGEEKAPRRYRTIVKRLRRYIELTSHAAGYETEIFERGDGLAVSRRCPAANESNRLSEEYHTC